MHTTSSIGTTLGFETRKYAQLYILDPSQAVAGRLAASNIVFKLTVPTVSPFGRDYNDCPTTTTTAINFKFGIFHPMGLFPSASILPMPRYRLIDFILFIQIRG